MGVRAAGIRDRSAPTLYRDRMSFRSRLIDTWSSLSHRRVLENVTVTTGGLAPTWVGPLHSRRVTAYTVLDQMLTNTARDGIEASDPAMSDAMDHYKEFGDPRVFRDAIVSAILGVDPPQILIDGADDDPPSDATDHDTRVAAAAARAARQDELHRWDERAFAGRELFLCEQHAVGNGDGALVFRINTTLGRVTVESVAPGFYFPVITQATVGYPQRVHIAWEYETFDENRNTVRWVRRQTWALVPLADGDAGARPGPDGTWVRDIPWTDPDADGEDAPTTTTKCVYTDGTWRLADLNTATVDDFTDRHAEWAKNEAGDTIRNLDLGIDFIPIVHIPNTPVSAQEHYGTSDLANVAQLHDEIAATDSDISAAAALVGTPMIGMPGGAPKELKVRPGAILASNDPTAGPPAVIDISGGVPVLRDLLRDLIDRRNANGRVPGAMLGMIDPSKIDAGVILRLSFGPLRALVGERRMVRDEKYALIVRIIQRLMIAAKFTTDRNVYPGRYVPTSFLPTDEAELVTRLRTLLGDGTIPAMISRATALRELADAGLLTDPADEQTRIESEDFAGAERMLAALGDGPWIDEWLHRPDRNTTPTGSSTPPVVDVTGTGTVPPNPTDTTNTNDQGGNGAA